MTIGQFESDLRAKSRQRWLLSRRGGDAIALAALESHGIASASSIQEFQDWNRDFSGRYLDLENKHEMLRQACLEKYLQQGAPLGQLRRVAVRGRWEYEKLFAEEGGDSARNELGYWTYEDNRDVFHHYNDDQLSGLLEGRTPRDQDVPLEGHHLTSVADASQHGDVLSVSDPHNISVVTREAHLYSPTHGHGGSFQNPTHEHFDEIDDRFHKVVQGQRHDVVYSHDDSHIGIAAGLVAGSIASVVQLYNLRSDPRPWKQKSAAVATTFALKGIQGSIIGLVALSTNDYLSELVSNNLDLVSDSLWDANSSDVLGGLVGSAGAIEAAVAVRALVRAVNELSQGASIGSVSRNAGEQLLATGGEQLGFILLGELLHAKTSLAVPAIGHIIMALRVGYGLAKAGKSIYDNKQSQTACIRRRMDVYYNFAVSSINSGK